MIKYLDWVAPVIKDNLEKQNHGFFRDIANVRMALGAIDFINRKDTHDVVERLHLGLRDFGLAIELGYSPSAWEMRDSFLASIALSDVSLGNFLASMPDEDWEVDVSSILSWLVIQTKVSFDLFRNDQSSVSQKLEYLTELTIESRIAKSLKKLMPEIKIENKILEAIFSGNLEKFDDLMVKRTQHRIERLIAENSNAILDVIDFAGLGFCRLARSQGWCGNVEDVYLPTHFLDVAFSKGPYNPLS